MILVSAVVSTYNSEEFIRGKIEDLLSQTIVDKLEIIIVNSGSTQNEDGIIKEYLHTHRNVKYIQTKERETVYAAWNKGIKIAEGEYITNSNTDDRLRKDAYEVLAGYLSDNSDVALVYGDQLFTNVKNQSFEKALGNSVIKFPHYTHLRQLDRCIIGSQPMWRASLHREDNIWFNETYEVSGDHDFELRVSENYKTQHIDEVLGTFYKSPTKSNKEFENMERTKKEVNEITSIYIDRYLSKLSSEELRFLQRKYYFHLLLPIILYEILKRGDKLLFPGIYPQMFFYSIEFVYYFSIQISLRLKDYKKAHLLCRKYLRYKTSNRISKIYDELKLTRR
ncbi:glycosyltransferase [Bacteroidota bacterium]